MNRSEIWSNIIRELLGLKWVGNTTRQLTPQTRAPGWRGLFGVHLLILHFNFQFSKSIKSSTFHIFLNLTHPLRKKHLFPKIPKNHPNIYTKPPNNGYGYELRDLTLLETWPRNWHKGRVQRRQKSLHVHPRHKSLRSSFISKVTRVHKATTAANDTS